MVETLVDLDIGLFQAPKSGIPEADNSGSISCPARRNDRAAIFKGAVIGPLIDTSRLLRHPVHPRRTSYQRLAPLLPRPGDQTQGVTSSHSPPGSPKSTDGVRTRPACCFTQPGRPARYRSDPAALRARNPRPHPWAATRAAGSRRAPESRRIRCPMRVRARQVSTLRLVGAGRAKAQILGKNFPPPHPPFRIAYTMAMNRRKAACAA